MKKLYTLLAVVGLMGFSSTSIAQCANDNIQFGTSAAPTTVGVPTQLTTCLFGGEYRLVTGLVAGSSYTFSTCGDTDFDTQLTIFDATTGAVVGYNDDACGVQSSVTIVSTGANVRVSLDQFFCTSNSSCMTLTATRVNGAGGPVNPCNSITAIACGGTGSFTLSGSGSFTGNGPFSTPGAERIYSFTPTASGAHTITVSHTGGGWVDLFFRTQASGCSGSGWTYVDDILGSASNSVSLTAGVPVYFMVDDEDLTTSTGTISVVCPSAVNPCNSIATISGCGVSTAYSLPAGSGVFNNNGPFLTPGNERIFQFTAPLTGAYEVNVTHNGGYYSDLFFRTAASGCSGTGWTYVSDIFSVETNTVNLVGGTTYYFMMDDEDLNASSGTINITCPCIPSTTPSGTFTYDGPFTISGTTVDACNNCSLRPSDDRIYAVEIPCTGTYTFATCGGASWDTYLYLTTAFCGGTTIALNDDACGLQSSVTATLSPGTYYIHVEGFSITSEGAFTISVSGNIPDIQMAITGSTNVSCFGGNDGSATAAPLSGTMPFNFEWSDGQSTATASGLSAGTYTVGGKDANNCPAAPVSVTITEPTQLVAAASNTVIPCFGGSSDVTVTASGGTPGYTGTGGFTVPAGTYTYTVTDANNCSASVTLTITQPDQIEANITPQNHVIDCIPIPVTLTANPTGGTGGPYTYLWSTGATTASISVNPNVTTSYSVQITDANGCTENASTNGTTVTVINRCGNNNQKVVICHVPPGNSGNPQTLCISPNALNPHLSSLWDLHGGDYCGACQTSSNLTLGTTNTGDNTFIRAGINMNNETIELSYRIGYDSEVRLEIYDMAGTLVDVVHTGKAMEGELYDLKLNTDKISSGVYIYQFITDSETHIDKLQIIQE